MIFCVGKHVQVTGTQRRRAGMLRRAYHPDPPGMQNTPGVSTLTGGRRIPLRARIVLRSGKVVQQSPYRGRIGEVPDRKKGIPEWWVPGGFFRREVRLFFVGFRWFLSGGFF